MTPRLLFVVNEAWFFVSHRLELALGAQRAGYDVHVATPMADAVAEIVAHGLTHHPIRMGRRSTNPLRELASVRDLWRLYRRLRPDVVHHVTSKPVLYGGVVARLASVPGVISAVTGLGYVFIGSDWRARALRRVIAPAYRVALSHPRGIVIVQNPDDRKLLIELGASDAERSRLIKGAGVDMTQFTPPETERADGDLRVLLASRMLWDKGIGEFVEAARALRARGVRARFLLAGGTDPGNPAAITEVQLRAWTREGVVEWLGHRPDMPALLRDADVVCLPSYREGLPRVLIEAAACGRPIVTTDVPGCREVVVHGETGLLVPARDAEALATALERLLRDRALRRSMGLRSRAIVEKEYSMQHVIEATLAAYRDVLRGAA